MPEGGPVGFYSNWPGDGPAWETFHLDELGGILGRDWIEATVLRESRAFVRRARELGIPVRTRFYGAGRHAWPYWERELRRALPILLETGA